MEIFIIRDGKQTGPYTEDAVQALLDKGSVRSKDMGWRKGLAAWLPLSEVLKQNSERVNQPPPVSAERAGTNGTSRNGALATAKQKALLKYLGVEFSDDVTKAEAAVVISDALEAPKFQGRIAKWHEEKLRLHPNAFQDEIDFRKANRTIRYLESCQTEGAEMVKDVTKAHVQVLVESLDKRFPNWESEPKTALWDYLLPSIAEHFPKLVLPAAKGRLRLGGIPKMAAAVVRKPVVGSLPTAPPPPGPFAAAVRGIIYGTIALGVIFIADHFFGSDHFLKSFQTGGGKPAAQAPAPSVQPPEPPKEATPPKPAEAPVVAAKPPENPTAVLPEIPPANPAPAPVAPAEPAMVPPAPVPAPAPAMAENKPPMTEEKPAIPPAPAPPVAPAPAPPEPPAPAPVAPAAPRTSVILIQGISVALPNGQVTLPAGTQLKYLALEGQNVRVSWNNNVFYVPLIATDLSRDPSPPPAAPAATPPATPGALPAPPAPRKPGDDL